MIEPVPPVDGIALADARLRCGEWTDDNGAKSAAAAQLAHQFRHSRSAKPSKPNTLPVLNCLFSALKGGSDGDNDDNDREDDTPYMEIPANGSVERTDVVLYIDLKY